MEEEEEEGEGENQKRVVLGSVSKDQLREGGVCSPLSTSPSVSTLKEALFPAALVVDLGNSTMEGPFESLLGTVGFDKGKKG